MMNEPPENSRRPHPLEVKPKPPQQPVEPQNQQMMLHIPVVKPYATYILIAINLAIYLIFGMLLPEVYDEFVRYGANQQTRVLTQGEYHRLLTAMFLHGGFAHVIFNMYALYAIGSQIESLFGHVRFLLIYFLGGIAGSILSVMFNDPFTFSVGASGAVFAIFGAEMVYLYHHRKLLGAQGRAALQNLLWIAVLNFGIGIFSSLSSEGVTIDNWGHAGGLIGGLILAWYISPILIPKRDPTRPDVFVAADINPLKNRYTVISLYLAGLIVLLIVAQQFIS